MITFIDPKSKPSRYREGTVMYGGRRYEVALFTVGAQRFQLSMADTHQCTESEDVARRVLENTLAGAGMAERVNGEAMQLMQHCRKITKWKESNLSK